MVQATTEAIVNDLNKLERSLETKVTNLKQQLQEAQSELERTRGAVRQLTGQKSKSKTKSPNGKPSPTRAIVIETAEAVLRHKKVMSEDKLKVTVEKLLVEANYSKSGYALRYREALADERFVETPGGYRLREADTGAGKQEPSEAEAIT